MGTRQDDDDDDDDGFGGGADDDDDPPGVAPGIFQWGLTPDEGTNIWFSEYYKCQKSPKNRFSPSDGGLACSLTGGYSPLALPRCHPCDPLILMSVSSPMKEMG